MPMRSRNAHRSPGRLPERTLIHRHGLDALQDLDCGRLPGAVGPEDGEHLTNVNGEGDTVDGSVLAIVLGEAEYLIAIVMHAETYRSWPETRSARCAGQTGV